MPKYQVPVATKLSDYIDDARATNEPEITFGAYVAASQSVNEPEVDAIDMSLVPVSRQEPSTYQESDNSIGSTLNA